MHTLMTHQELLGVHHRSQGHLNTVSGGAGDGTENLQEGLPLSRDERVHNIFECWTKLLLLPAVH